MKIEIQDSFSHKLSRQIDFISSDKPKAARKFKADLIKRIKGLSQFPFRYKQSTYFKDDTIREMVFKGYTIVYKVDSAKSVIRVFGLIKQEDDLDLR